MAQAILLRGAKQLLTLRGPSGARRDSALRELGLIEDGSVLIRDGVIVALGTTRRIENLKEARSALEMPVNGKIVMPAFVDAGLNLDEQHQMIGSASPGKRSRSTEFFDRTLSLLHSCLRHGTLTAELKTPANFEDPRAGLPAIRQLARIGDNPISTVRTCRVDRISTPDEDASRRIAETLSALARRKLAHYVEVDVNSEPERHAVPIAVAEQSKLAIKVSWAGGSSDNLRALLSRLRPVSVSCSPLISFDECSILSKTQAIAVFSTGTEVLEVTNTKSARNAVDSGAAIALSTGYDFNHTLTFNMQTAVALAVMRLKLTPEEAIAAATINAAYATGRANSIGSIEVGKRADLLVLNLSDYRQLSRQFGVNHVDLVLRGGNVVFTRTFLKPENEPGGLQGLAQYNR